MAPVNPSNPLQPGVQATPGAPQPFPAGSLAGSYTPSPEEAEIIADIERKFVQWRTDRQPYEQQWFINAAFYRGNHFVEWSDQLQKLVTPKQPPHRVRIKANRLQSKVRVRLSKFFKNRPRPIVVPATTEYRDYANAKATQKALDYLWRKLRLELKFKKAVLWAKDCGKGFWWFHWDPNVTGRVALKDQLTGATTYKDAALGDIVVEPGSPFEVFVADPGAAAIGEQPEIMRVKLRDLADVQARYSQFAPFLAAESDEEGAFRYEKQIATLNTQTLGTTLKKESLRPQILVKEHFIRPSAEFPEGAYRVLAGKVLVKNELALPWGFHDLDNPFPVVEFTDLQVAGQFWCPTVLEQLVDLQREYNLLHSKLAETNRLMAWPKLLVATQHQLPKGVWTSEPGEVIEYTGQKELGPPVPWHPPNVSGDLWRALELIQDEFDAITQIYPVAEGQTAATESGFQVNLLQEATDSVHAPDVRMHELSIEEASVKLRRLMKLGYTAPRMLSLLGAANEPEVFEFSASQIDEMADIVVEVGSALPTLKAAKQEAVMMLYDKALLGDPLDPEVKRKAMSLLEMGGLEEAFDAAKQHEIAAKIENREWEDGRDPLPPRVFHDHRVHAEQHLQELNSPVAQRQPPERVLALLAHAILHIRFFDAPTAMMMAMEEGLGALGPMIQPFMPLPPAVGPDGKPLPGGGPAGAPPPPPGAPPPA